MRRILLSTAKILISAALLYLALRKVDLTELLSRFTASSLFWIGMAISATFLQIFVGVLRWREVSAACGAPLELGRAMRYNVIGSFSGDARSYALALDFISKHRDTFPFARMITGRYRLDEVNLALERMKRLEETKPVMSLA